MNLDQDLRYLATDVQFRAAPDIAGRLGAQLPPRRARFFRRPWLPLAVAALLALVLTFAIPQSREAVARWLSFGGIHIVWVDHLTNGGDNTPIDSALIVGEEASRTSVTGVLAMPNQEPAAVYRRIDNDAVDTVSLVYAPNETLPEIDDSGVGLLLMQTDATIDFFPFIKRALRTEPGSRFVIVGDGEGYWVATGELVTTPYDPEGVFGLAHVTRRTGNVLIWQADGVTYRLESALSRPEAVALAESLVPLTEPS